MQIIKGCAMRGRYDENNRIRQHIEIRDDFISNAITTVQKDSLILILETDRGMINIENFIEIHNDFIKVREATKQGYAIAREGDSINLEQPNSKTRRGRVGRSVANTLTCSCNQGVVIEQRDSKHMWKNELEKFKFNMDEIKLFDSFAGKGALHKALKKLGVPTKVIGLSEIEPDAIIAYAGVHIKDFINLEFDYPSDDEMKEWLMNRNIGWDFAKQKSSIPRMKKDKLKLLYKASIMTNNFGDISVLDYSKLPDFDLFNFSFPCQDISNAGKQKGLKNDDGTHTRSGLVKFGIDLIKAKKPKYIMIENVKGLIQKKFIDDFYDIVNEIESYGYKCHYATKEDKKNELKPICLNAKDYGIPQNRERIFVICMRNDINIDFKFPEGFDSGIRLKDILEDEVDEKYYLSQQVQEKFILNGKQDLSHTKTIFKVRKFTPLCCWRLMGFDDEDFYNAKELGLSDSALYKLAGNSIVCNCLYYIFKEVFKQYIVK